VARILAVVQLATSTSSRPTLRHDRRDDDDDHDEGTQQQADQQRRRHGCVELYRQPTMYDRSKMVLGHVAVDDGGAQSDAARQRWSTSVRRRDCHDVRRVDVSRRQGCAQSNFTRTAVDDEETIGDR